MRAKSEVKFKIGDQVTVDCFKWARVSDIEEKNQMLYVEDQDGEELCISFERVDLYL